MRTKSKADRFFEAAQRATVMCGGALYIGEALAKELRPYVTSYELWTRIGCDIAMLLLAIWSLWPRKVKVVPAAAPAPVCSGFKKLR